MIKAIIFDLGGVIVSPKVEKINDMMADFLKIDANEYKEHFSKYKPDLTRGKVSLEPVYAKILKEFKKKDITAKDALKKHLEIFSDIIKDLDENLILLVKKLRMKKYKVVCLVNAELDVVPLVRARGAYSHFEKAYISVEMGMMKPDPAFYMTAIRELKCKPQEAIFIDDNIDYAKAAEALGIKGIHYKPGVDLKKELIARGVLL